MRAAAIFVKGLIFLNGFVILSYQDVAYGGY